MPQESLVNFFKFYEDEPHQMEAVQLLQQAMPDNLLKSDAAWIQQYRQKPEPSGEAMLANPLDCALLTAQLDNPSGEGYRALFFLKLCNGCALYWKPVIAKRRTNTTNSDPSTLATQQTPQRTDPDAPALLA